MARSRGLAARPVWLRQSCNPNTLPAVALTEPSQGRKRGQRTQGPHHWIWLLLCWTIAGLAWMISSKSAVSWRCWKLKGIHKHSLNKHTGSRSPVKSWFIMPFNYSQIPDIDPYWGYSPTSPASWSPNPLSTYRLPLLPGHRQLRPGLPPPTCGRFPSKGCHLTAHQAHPRHSDGDHFDLLEKWWFNGG